MEQAFVLGRGSTKNGQTSIPLKSTEEKNVEKPDRKFQLGMMRKIYEYLHRNQQQETLGVGDILLLDGYCGVSTAVKYSKGKHSGEYTLTNSILWSFLKETKDCNSISGSIILRTSLSKLRVGVGKFVGVIFQDLFCFYSQGTDTFKQLLGGVCTKFVNSLDLFRTSLFLSIASINSMGFILGHQAVFIDCIQNLLIIGILTQKFKHVNYKYF